MQRDDSLDYLKVSGDILKNNDNNNKIEKKKGNNKRERKRGKYGWRNGYHSH